LFFFVCASLLAGIFVGLLNYLLVKTALVKPLTEVINTAQGIARGNYNSVCIYALGRHDLVGRLGEAINKMAAAINEKQEKLLLMAKTDDLTQVFNRRSADQQLVLLKENEVNNVFVVLIDVDKFKMFNDLYGHVMGDNILYSVAQSLKPVNDEYFLARYGGDEFVAIFTNTSKKNVQDTINDWFSKIKKLTLEINEQKIPVTLSIGVATFPDDTNSIKGLTSLADKAMYNVKYKGGNGLVFYSDSTEFSTLSSATYKSLEGLIFALDSRDNYTRCHSDQVAKIALAIYQAMDSNELSEELIMIAGLLHDVGKVGLPNDILNKLGYLTEDEYALVQKHPIIGKQIIELLLEKNAEEIIKGVLYHHERYDGKGYPQGLKGEEIPLIARILAVADAFSAMSQDRVYRKGLSVMEIMKELRDKSGQQFDPKIAAVFIELLKKTPQEFLGKSFN